MPQQAPPTQQFNKIETVKDGAVVLNNGSLRKILAVSGINIALKSEEENNQILATFQNFLNSLDFSIQLIIHSRKINIDHYLNNLREREKQETNDLLKSQLKEYIEFIKILVEDSTIMTKSFYVVVSWDAASIVAQSQSLAEKAKSIFGLKKKTGVSSAELAAQAADFDKKKMQLDQRAWIVESGLRLLGLNVIPLNTEQVIELFYNLYNPAVTERKDLKIAEEFGGKF